MARFTIEKAFSQGWEAFKKNPGLIIGALVLSGIAYYIPAIISTATADDSSGVSFLFTLLSWIVGVMLQVGIATMTLKLIDSKPAAISDLWSHGNFFLRMLGATILYSLMVFVGTILLIIPGIYLGIRYQFYAYAMVDKNLGVMESLKQAGEITKGSWWMLLLLGVLEGILFFVGALPLGLGLILVIPLVALVTASVYRQLSGGAVSAPIAPAMAAAPAAAAAPAVAASEPAMYTSEPEAPDASSDSSSDSSSSSD